MTLRVNIGCGQTPTKGWRNFDNSLSLRFAKIPFLPNILSRLKIINRSQYEFVQFAGVESIEYGDATKELPLQNNSVEVVYSSHMLEHLDRNKVVLFLKEAYRILCPGGLIRIAVPDIKILVDQYIETGDADIFIKSTRLCAPSPTSFIQKLRFLLVGARNHQWMYDGNSLSRLIMKHGFTEVNVTPAGQTRILNHEPLDLCERESESLYVEALKPISI